MTECNNSKSNFAELLLAQRLAAVRSRQRGTTLIEMLIVIVIMSTISLGILYLMTAQYNSAIQGQQMYLQQSSESTLTDVFESKTSGVSGSDLALTTSGGAVDPLSYAGDQFLFTTNSGACYRVFYLGYKKELRVAISSDGCAAIAPARGPNQAVAGGGYLESDPDAADWDPILDTLNGGTSFILASNVTLTDGSSSPTFFNAPFRFYNADGSQQYLTDGTANSGSVNSFYDDASGVNSTGEIQLDFQLGNPDPSNISIPDRTFQLTLYMDN
jgi:prepilin-type N-terminal cleavage/methylation domain-containing protein